jgi:molybdopterin synthase catalytic subunit
VGTVRLLEVREQPLSVDDVLDAVRHPGAGGTAVFVGTVREQDGGRAVEGLDYSAHPTVTTALQAVAATVLDRHDVLALAAVHRVGDLAVGDLAVVAAVACPHRSEAFDACRTLVDELKATVPIWKHQRFADGSDEWVGTA